MGQWQFVATIIIMKNNIYILLTVLPCVLESAWNDEPYCKYMKGSCAAQKSNHLYKTDVTIPVSLQSVYSPISRRATCYPKSFLYCRLRDIILYGTIICVIPAVVEFKSSVLKSCLKPTCVRFRSVQNMLILYFIETQKLNSVAIANTVFRRVDTDLDF